MANIQKKNDLEQSGEGWSRFERAVDAAVKSGPQHKSPAAKSDKSDEPAGEAKRSKKARRP